MSSTSNDFKPVLLKPLYDQLLFGVSKCLRFHDKPNAERCMTKLHSKLSLQLKAIIEFPFQDYTHKYWDYRWHETTSRSLNRSQLQSWLDMHVRRDLQTRINLALNYNGYGQMIDPGYAPCFNPMFSSGEEQRLCFANFHLDKMTAQTAESLHRRTTCPNTKACEAVYSEFENLTNARTKEWSSIWKIVAEPLSLAIHCNEIFK